MGSSRAEEWLRRNAVEEAESWANGTLQMAARRSSARRWCETPQPSAGLLGKDRLGCLLYRRVLTRRLILPRILREVFATTPGAEREVLAELPAALDRVDAWIDAGVLGGAELNAADFMVAPSLALMLYRPDIKPMFEGVPRLSLSTASCLSRRRLESIHTGLEGLGR